MKSYSILFLTAFSIFSIACSNGQNQASSINSNLNPIEFQAKIKSTPNAVILDVRTPEEFAEGHLENAINMNWNDQNFKSEISKIKFSDTIFIYCLSGGRSSTAANFLRTSGYQLVYEMSGGIMKWRGANLPLTTQAASTSSTKSSGMTLKDFNELLNSEQLVLVDFYADWCAPCVTMKPYLEEISKEKAGKVKLVRINVEENKTLTNELKIDALPVLQLYQNKNIIWSNIGLISKADILKKLE